MHETDKDIETLERLLGGAKTDYRALRHDRPLETRRAAPRAPAPRPTPLRRYALAASVLLAVAALAVTVVEQSWQPDPTAGRPSPLALSRPAGPSLSLQPDRPWRTSLAIDRPRSPGTTIGLRLPRRPSRANG